MTITDFPSPLVNQSFQKCFIKKGPEFQQGKLQTFYPLLTKDTILEFLSIPKISLANSNKNWDLDKSLYLRIFISLIKSSSFITVITPQYFSVL